MLDRQAFKEKINAIKLEADLLGEVMHMLAI
jgi:hypothetical protein